MRKSLWLLISVVGLIALACGGDPSTRTNGNSMQMGDEGTLTAGHYHGPAFGEPARATEADRKIEVVTKDDFTYGPSAIKVFQGETITFVVTNSGNAVHAFVLGDEGFQQEHKLMMEDMGSNAMHNEPSAISLRPNETKELTWRFTEAVDVLYACHVQGHYDAGMIGTITVDNTQ